MDGISGLDRAALERARISRDPRFDGKFFIAVTSTGIYCRPVCPSRSSNSVNVRYFATAAQAAEAGFRPCLRCRPEAAPGTPAWLGTSAVVRRALRLIEDGILDETSVDGFAASLGFGPRHLRRLFVQHVGASPMTVARTRRVSFAKRLLDDTRLPITHIALAAGFHSVRRFNAAFRRVYGRAPGEIRRRRGGGRADEVVLRLAYRPPYDWAHAARVLAERAIVGVERVDERGYARTVATEGGFGLVRVRPLDGEPALELCVSGASPAELFRLCVAARRTFDLAADPELIAGAFAPDPLLGATVAAHPGVRIIGSWDPFECAVRVLLGGPATATLVARLGRPIAAGEDGLTRGFPAAQAVAQAEAGAQTGCLRALGRAVAAGTIDFTGASEEVVAALARLTCIRDADEVALRALGEPDAFPVEDLVLRRVAGGDVSLTPRELALRAEAWRPWRGYAAYLLWQAAR